MCWGRLAEGGANGDREIGQKSVEGVRPTFNDSAWTVDEPLRIKVPIVPTKAITKLKTKIGDSWDFDNAGNAVDKTWIGARNVPVTPFHAGWPSFQFDKGPTATHIQHLIYTNPPIVDGPSPLYIQPIRIDIG